MIPKADVRTGDMFPKWKPGTYGTYSLEHVLVETLKHIVFLFSVFFLPDLNFSLNSIKSVIAVQ